MRNVKAVSITLAVFAFSATAHAATSTTTPGKADALKGTALSQTEEGVVIDLGEKEGLKIGDRIEFFEEKEWLLAGTIKEERLSVGVVAAVTPDKSIVVMGPNERVPAGASARLTQEQPTADQSSPPRLPGILEIRAHVRPFLGIKEAGGGLFGDASVTYRFDAPVALRAELLPLAVAGGSGASESELAGAAVVSLDLDLFEVGAGLGFITGSGDDAALTINQLGRVGSTDGIHFLIRNGFYLRSSEFRHGFTETELLIPVTGRLALVGRGGGSGREFGYGEAGMRFRLKGNGDRGTIYLTPTIGGASIRDFVGPSVGVGVDWRL